MHWGGTARSLPCSRASTSACRADAPACTMGRGPHSQGLTVKTRQRAQRGLILTACRAAAIFGVCVCVCGGGRGVRAYFRQAKACLCVGGNAGCASVHNGQGCCNIRSPLCMAVEPREPLASAYQQPAAPAALASSLQGMGRGGEGGAAAGGGASQVPPIPTFPCDPPIASWVSTSTFATVSGEAFPRRGAAAA